LRFVVRVSIVFFIFLKFQSFVLEFHQVFTVRSQSRAIPPESLLEPPQQLGEFQEIAEDENHQAKFDGR